MFDEPTTNLFDTASQPPQDGVASPATEVVPADNGVPAEAPGHQRYADAGRKGAKRIHQLIRQGRLYEQEHGLKRGRQRLRQLIEEGKLYEQEHGLAVGPPPRRQRLSRQDREQVLLGLFEALLRMVKPSFRGRLKRLLEVLDGEKN
jgi:hypothetical protein